MAVETFGELRDEIDGLDSQTVVLRLRELEGRRRTDEAECALLLSRIERDKSYKADGHSTIFGLLRSTLGWSDKECRQRTRTARLVQNHPSAGESLFETWVSVANVAAIAKAHANPRCRDKFDRVVGTFLHDAERSEHHELQTEVNRWIVVNDRAARRRQARAHANREARMMIGKAGGSLAAHWGALDAARNREVFDKFLDAEFEADWAKTVELHGDEASSALLPRTAAQRAADALTAIFQAAAARPPKSKAPAIVTNLHVDWHTFQEWMVERQLFPQRQIDPFEDPTPLVSRLRCETGDGVVIDPDTMMRHLLEGFVRFVILDEAGVPIKWGRQRRLFTGAARDAVMSLSSRCTHPGCRVRAGCCEADHLTPWGQGGHTSPHNGGPKCGNHNRLRNRGYASHRDRQGRWHTIRPDGSEIG